MADTKITALTAIGLNPIIPSTFPIPMVDLTDTSMAASGTTKKVTVNQILGAGGTATLASATITGDLTVDTSTLKVDSANNRVGIVQATPLYPLHLIGEFGLQEDNPAGTGTKLRFIGDATKYNFRLGKQLTANNTFEITPSTAVGGGTFSNPVYTVSYDGIHTFLDGAGGTRMTLNSTGLGVGVSPNFKLDVAGAANSAPITLLRLNNTGTTGGGPGIAARLQFNAGATALGFVQGCNFASGSIGVQISGDGTNIHQTIDSSGNVGIGVTPSYKLDVAGSGRFTNNIYVPSSVTYKVGPLSATWAGLRFDSANAMFLDSDTSISLRVNGGTSFLTAMTLDASGNLLVGKTVSLFSTVGVEASGTGFISATNSASTNATTNLSVYSTGAAAFRFYVGLGGTVYATNTTISAISDARLKENVQDIDVGLGAILALKPRKFDWKEGKGKNIKGDRGFIAQEFEQVFPQLVDEWKDAAPEGEAPYKSVRQDLIPVLVKAIQELAVEVNALKNA